MPLHETTITAFTANYKDQHVVLTDDNTPDLGMKSARHSPGWNGGYLSILFGASFTSLDSQPVQKWQDVGFAHQSLFRQDSIFKVISDPVAHALALKADGRVTDSI